MKKTKRFDKVLFILLAFLFFMLPLVFCPLSNDFFKLPKWALFHILSLILFSTCFLNAESAKRCFTAFLQARTALILFFIFLLSCFFSLFFAQSAFVGFKDFLSLASALMLFAVLCALPVEAFKHLVLFVFLSLALASIIGVLQHFGMDVTGLSALSGVSASFMASTLGHRNYLAELLCVTLPFGFALYLAFPKRTSRALLFASFCFMYGVLLLTNSRSGFLSFLLSTLFFCFVCANKVFPLCRLRLF